MPRAVVVARAIAITTLTAALVAPRAASAADSTPAARFVPVPTDIAPLAVSAPDDGQALVVGSDTTGALRVERRTPTLHQEVPLPTGLSADAPELAAGDGVAYLLAGTTLVRITGTRADVVPVPAADGDAAFTPRHVVVDGTTVWLTGSTVSPGDGTASSAVARLTGTRWTFLPGGIDGEDVVAPYAVGGHLLAVVTGGTRSLYRAKEWTGDAWRELPDAGRLRYGRNALATAWTLTSPTEYTMWGWAQEVPPATPSPRHGTCSQVLDGAVTACSAPDFGVDAATRTADGVVLGGTGPTSSGFARVPAQGGDPAPVDGDAGDGVRALAAAPGGHTVWALTTKAGATFLQVLTPSRPVPGPRPAHRRLPHLRH